MPAEFYYFLHVTGIILTLTSLSALAMLVMNLPAKGSVATLNGRKLLSALHGVGLLLLLVAGFGLMARLGIKTWDGWLITKIIIWGILGFIPFLIKRMHKQAMLLYIASLVLPTIAVYLVNYRPF